MPLAYDLNAQHPLQVVGGDVSLAVADAALVDHGPVVGHLHRLADAGLAALHDAQLVGRVVHAQRRHLLSRKPLPAGRHDEKINDENTFELWTFFQRHFTKDS